MTATSLAVLLADDDLFETGYIKAVLAARNIAVVGPFADMIGTLRAMETPGLCAAVIAPRIGHAKPDGLAAELTRRGIPYLTLTRAREIAIEDDRPILSRPFAAHQIADWIVQTVNTCPN